MKFIRLAGLSQIADKKYSTLSKDFFYLIYPEFTTNTFTYLQSSIFVTRPRELHLIQSHADRETHIGISKTCGAPRSAMSKGRDSWAIDLVRTTQEKP